jgi:enediyne biosynthesis protein E4
VSPWTQAGLLFVLGCASEPPDKPLHIVPAPGDSGLAGDTGEPEDTGEPAVELPEWLVATEVVHCDSPSEQVSYVEVGESVGLPGRVSEVFEHTESGAISVADLDGDGDLDIITSFIHEGAWAYMREGDDFIAEELPRTTEFQSMGVLDVDGDGTLELAVAGPDPSIVSWVEGDWQQVMLPAAPEDSLSSVTKALVPGDLDNDGDLDLYVLRSGVNVTGLEALDFVYINDGSGSFTADGSQVPESERFRKGFDAKWFDVDGDGWQDVYVVNERWSESVPTPGRDGTFLLRNESGQLRRDDQDCYCELSLDGMGVDIADVDRDGRPDIYVSASMNNVLLQQQADGSYADTSLLTGADPLDGTLLTMGWGSVFLDFDNDGRQDILVAEGDLWHELSSSPVVVDLPMHLMQQLDSESGTRFEEVSDAYGFEVLGSWRSIVALDHNGDGLVDPIITDVEARPRFYMSQGCTENGWLRVEAPVHSRIEITAGGFTQVAWVDTHSSFAAGQQPEVHFGLGPTETVELLVVDLPTGERRVSTQPFEARRKVWVH